MQAPRQLIKLLAKFDCLEEPELRLEWLINILLDGPHSPMLKNPSCNFESTTAPNNHEYNGANVKPAELCTSTHDRKICPMYFYRSICLHFSAAAKKKAEKPEARPESSSPTASGTTWPKRHGPRAAFVKSTEKSWILETETQHLSGLSIHRQVRKKMIGVLIKNDRTRPAIWP